MKKSKFPRGWDEKRVQEVIDYYENQTEEEAVAEAEAAFADPTCTVMVVPTELVPAIDRLIAKHHAASRASAKRPSKSTEKKRKRA
jgi:hypothetical protein